MPSRAHTDGWTAGHSGGWGSLPWGEFPWGGVEPTPPPVPAAVEAVTTEQILALITADNLTVAFGAELLDVDDLLVEDISLDLLNGEVEHQNYADVHGTISLSISRELGWETARVRPWQTLTGAGYYKTWPLGVYLLTTPETPLGETPITYAVSGYDKLHLLQRPVGDTYVVATGASYLEAVVAAITTSEAGGLAPLLDGTAVETLLPEPMVWVLDTANPTTYLRIVNDLLSAIGYRGVWADATGRFCSVPYQNPLVRSPMWTLDVSDQKTCIVGESRTLTKDIYEPTNWWRFVRTGMTAEPVEGTGFYTVDLSDGGTKYKSVQSLDVADQPSLVARGDEIVQTARQVTQTLDITTGPLPILGHFDVLEYVDPEAVGTLKCQVRSWRLPLGTCTPTGMASFISRTSRT